MTSKLKQEVKNLPLKPGVYIFKDGQRKILYIGKAKALKKRVSSYFTKKHHDKTKYLVPLIKNLEFIITDNEVEALILEARLIKQHKPKFNIALKDGVRYAYLKLTNEKFPRLLTVRVREKDGAQYFGPFTDGTARENSARLLRTIFKIRTCAPRLPKNVCLQYYLGNCDAPCVDKISEEDYAKNIKATIGVLKGGSKRVMVQLAQEMVKFSDRRNYELAKIRRDQISSLKRFQQKQKILMYKAYDEDILHWVETEDKVYAQLFKVDKGRVSGKEEFVFDKSGDVIESFIRQYYSTNEIPDVLIIPKKIQDQELIENYLTKIKGKRVSIKVPTKGRKKQLLDLVYKNLLYATEQEDQELLTLRDHLNLSGIPYVIECFDISTILGQYSVGSMVQFRGGQPDKSNYRKFRIKTVNQQDDFASMAEVVRRRYSRLIKEKKELPNLIVIDGGRGQLNAAWAVLKELKLKIPIIGLAKREEEIYQVEREKPLKLGKKDKGLHVLIRIRNEAHRFAIAYHRLLRKKGMKK